jgi:putative PIN family toxin of toxin-antitoxin system
MISAVFDTNVILQAILNEGGPADECTKEVFTGKIQLVTTENILREISEVVSRPALKSKYPILRSERPAELIEKIRSVAAVVEHPPPIYAFERDKTDEVFLNLALGFGVHYLVSRDRDLLDLRSDELFVTRFPDLSIVTPVGFLEVFRAV